jgi:dienelactone hydrolase
MLKQTVFIAALAAAGLARAEIVAQPLEYEYDGAKYASVLVYDDASTAKRPGLVMVPNWMGVTDKAIAKAKKLAGDDYVILLADVFGAGVRPADATEAMAQVKKMYADAPGLRRKVGEAHEQLAKQAGKAPVDASKIGAIGFCFGGGATLEYARGGGDIAGVASFHGNLKASSPAQPGAVKASLLVLNGADDASVKTEDKVAFADEMDAAKVDWQLIDYSGAVHCFSEEGDNNPPNCVYNERAAKRAERAMHAFFAEKFGTTTAASNAP